MESKFYTEILTILYSICLFASVILFFFSSEKKQEFVIYKRSRYIVGVVFLFYSILCFIYSYDGLRAVNKLYAGAISLSVYYISGILLGYSLIPLLNKSYYNRKRIILDSLRYLVFLCFIAAAFILETPYAEYALVLSCLYFFLDIVRIIIIFRINYRKCIKDINNFHSEYNVETYINWMYKVTILLITYGLSFVLVVYTSEKFMAIFDFLGIFLITYIVIAFNNYLVHIDKINKSQYENEKDINETSQNKNGSLSYTEIEKKLQNWIEQKRFLTEGITIITLCEELNTNRTYLSQYINTTYNNSFRDFIASLRIEEAKKMLTADFTKNIQEIAANTGFSTTSNFYRSFKKTCNMTPANYRKKEQART